MTRKSKEDILYKQVNLHGYQDKTEMEHLMHLKSKSSVIPLSVPGNQHSN